MLHHDFCFIGVSSCYFRVSVNPYSEDIREADIKELLKGIETLGNSNFLRCLRDDLLARQPRVFIAESDALNFAVNETFQMRRTRCNPILDAIPPDSSWVLKMRGSIENVEKALTEAKPRDPDCSDAEYLCAAFNERIISIRNLDNSKCLRRQDVLAERLKASQPYSIS